MQTLEQYEPFVINSCGVVLNPILVGVQYSKYGFISHAIAVGEIDGLWYAGYTYEDDNNQGGGASPVCASKYKRIYETPTDALLAQIASIERWNLNGRTKLAKTLEMAKEEIDNYLHPMQLTLF